MMWCPQPLVSGICSAGIKLPIRTFSLSLRGLRGIISLSCWDTPRSRAWRMRGLILGILFRIGFKSGCSSSWGRGYGCLETCLPVSPRGENWLSALRGQARERVKAALSPGRMGPVFDKKTERLVCMPLPPVGLSFTARPSLAVFHVVWGSHPLFCYFSLPHPIHQQILLTLTPKYA